MDAERRARHAALDVTFGLRFGAAGRFDVKSPDTEALRASVEKRRAFNEACPNLKTTCIDCCGEDH